MDYQSIDLQFYINQVQEKATQDSTNFEQLCTKHNELILKMGQRNNKLDELKQKITTLEYLVNSNNRNKQNPCNNNPKDKHFTASHMDTLRTVIILARRTTRGPRNRRIKL
jgi:hypothetical protein